jgi:hypothetical protein
MTATTSSSKMDSDGKSWNIVFQKPGDRGLALSDRANAGSFESGSSTAASSAWSLNEHLKIGILIFFSQFKITATMIPVSVGALRPFREAPWLLQSSFNASIGFRRELIE